MRHNYSDRLNVAAAQNTTERDFWLRQLSGEWSPAGFPYDFDRQSRTDQGDTAEVGFHLPPPLCAGLMKLCGGLDIKLHMVLTTVLTLLLHKYTGSSDILVGSPALKQAEDSQFINTVLVFRTLIDAGMSFRESLLEVRTTIIEATRHQNYPLAVLQERLGLPDRDHGFPFFDVALLLENIHHRKYLQDAPCSMLFSFSRSGDDISGSLHYHTGRYRPETAAMIGRHFQHLLDRALDDVDRSVAELDILSSQEWRQLLPDPGQAPGSDPAGHTLQRLWQEQVGRTPHRIAAVGPGGVTAETAGDMIHVSYRALDSKAARLARLLQSKGVTVNSVVAILLPSGIDMLAAIWGILKAGAAYLPIDIDTPSSRAAAMLEESGAAMLLTGTGAAARRAFTTLQGLTSAGLKPRVTAPRERISDLDALPMPDRSVLDYEKYNRFIGYAGVKHTISLEATRGCPYGCTFCHKIFPRQQVSRSAENLFDEVKYYYDRGVRRFSIIDDIFNLDIKNSSRFFNLIISNKLKPHLFFSAGLRGDILTGDYIDLMVEAGTVNMSPALETASPRLQKYIGKHLDIDRFRRNIQYICRTYPQVILELFIMHGFPTETEAEARETLDFVRDLRWIHFPYINILRIYSSTRMAQLAVEQGIPFDAIVRSEDLAWHELPETLPFPRSFTLKYQTEFLNDYFLHRERLRHVLPYQVRLMTEDELVEKYNSYLPVEIDSFKRLLEFTGIAAEELGNTPFLSPGEAAVPRLNEKLRPDAAFKETGAADGVTLKVLLLDLNLYFSAQSSMLYDLVDEPLGLIRLLTQLKHRLGRRIEGRIAKSRIDFDDYRELRDLVDAYEPDVIGIRTLTFYRDFFHRTVSLLRQWGIKVPIVAGGPHVTTNFNEVLQDRNIDLAVLGEGEITFVRLMEKMVEQGGGLPADDVLEAIPGLAFVPRQGEATGLPAREILMLDAADHLLPDRTGGEPLPAGGPGDPAYVIFTSGTTARPKGVLVSHANVVANLHAFYREFEVNAADTVIQLSSCAFDVFVEEIFPVLLRGGKVVIAAEHDILDIHRLSEQLIARHHVNIIDCTPLLLNEFNRHPLHFLKGIDLFISGGDELMSGHVDRLVGVGTVYNTYGPTETTVCATYHRLSSPPAAEIPIGKPIDRYRVYILGRDLNLLPPGVPGELCIGGDGVAAGYLNRPELTAERFVRVKLNMPAALLEAEGRHPLPVTDRIYRSGDLGRRLPDGNLLFLGRIDQQVKIRGYRIEPAEIENRLLSHPQIQAAAVIARTDSGGEKYLCAFVVPTEKTVVLDGVSGSPPDTERVEELKGFLKKSLPEYMVPPFVVFLERIPLTPHGKLDSRALPDPKLLIGGEFVAPRDDIESGLAELWAAILGVEKSRIGIDADFFDLGGNSLKAIQLIARMHKKLGVKVGLTQVFGISSIRELSEYVRELSPGIEAGYTAVEAAEAAEYFPLSSAQKRIYILQQMEPTLTVYNMPCPVKLRGDLDHRRLESAFHRLIERHESLRTLFLMIEGEPVQRPGQGWEFRIQRVEWDSEKGNHSPALDTVIGGFIRPFDLSRLPLLRVGLVDLGCDEYILIIDMHHIISDGISHRIFIRDLLRFYRGDLLPPLRIQYRDFSRWQSRRQQELTGRQEIFWLREFNQPPPLLNLPADYPRPAVQVFSGRTIGFSLEREAVSGLRNLSRQQGTTLNMVLLALFNVLLCRLCGQEDVVVGVPVAGRLHADLERIIGLFVNTLAIRNYPYRQKPFLAFLQEVRAKTLQAFENQAYPFEELVEKTALRRDVSRNPLFDVLFMMQESDAADAAERAGDEEIPGLHLEPYEYENTTAKFDLSFSCIDKGDGLDFVVEYCDVLFKEATCRRLAAYFSRIVSAVLDDSRQAIGVIDYIPEPEKRQLLREFNRSAAPLPEGQTLHGLFVRQAEKKAGHLALTGPDEAAFISYRRLHERSDRLARCLSNRGVGPGSLVALMAAPSPDLVIGILAILKAGAAYLPVDPAYPEKRIRYLLDDSGTEILLTDTTALKGIPPPDFNCDTVIVGSFRENRNHDIVLPENKADGRVAYCIYTSGSTGQPKGVLVEHAAVINLLYALQRSYPLTGSDAYLLKTPVIFDVSVTELFHWMLPGGRLVLMAAEGRRDPRLMMNAIQRQRVTHVNFVPAMFKVFLEHLKDSNIHTLASLKYIFVAGEVLLPDLVDRFRRLETGIALENLYGPTESTVYASGYSLARWREEPSVPIGGPLANIELFCLDSPGYPQGIGVPGELCIAGRGLARGYLNNPELTAEKFTRTGGTGWRRLYRTGDLARWQSSGRVEFLGRLDRQVKVRGFRIEPAEVENLLSKHEGIREAVILERDNGDGVRSLCAYIVPENSARPVPGSPQLREYLSAGLPDYMVPSHFVSLERIPRSLSGKVDRTALENSGVGPERESRYIAPATNSEKIIAEVWRTVLSLDQVGVEENIFDLGGTSIDLIRINARLSELFKRDIPVVNLFRYPNIRAFDRYLNRPGGADTGPGAADLTGQLARGKQSKIQRLRKRRGEDHE